MQRRGSYFEVHCRVRRQDQLQASSPPDFSGREEGAHFRQQHRQGAARAGAAVRPKGVQQNRALHRVRTVGGEVGDEQPRLPAGQPRLGRLPIYDDGEPPAQLDPHRAPQGWFQRFDNLSAKDNDKAQVRQSPAEGAVMASQVICECGYVMRDDDEDRVVALVRDHIRTDHPELVDIATPDIIRTWIEITP